MKNSSKRLKVIQPEKFIICKKILTLVLLINIQACYSAAVIDDFVENSLDKNLQIKPYTPSIINDEFAESNKKYSRIKPYEKLKPYAYLMSLKLFSYFPLVIIIKLFSSI